MTSIFDSTFLHFRHNISAQMPLEKKIGKDMKRKAEIRITALMALLIGCPLMFACGGEEEPEEHHYSEYDDSTGLAVTDSITVIFGDKTWKSLTYSAVITQEQYSVYRWAEIKANKPGSDFPAFKLKIFLEPGGNHTTQLAVNNPGLGYTVPGALTGDSKGGSLLYYEKGEVRSPDGTRTSDWWPLQITTSVLKYDNKDGKLTARVTARMFNYRSWVDREKLNVEDCEQRDLSITFGGLPL